MSILKTAVAGVVLVAVGLAAWLAWPLPVQLLEPPATTSITLLDRFGQPLRVARAEDGGDHRWIALGDVDPDVLRAFVTLEDHRFTAHPGIDLLALLRAVRENWPLKMLYRQP